MSPFWSCKTQTLFKGCIVQAFIWWQCERWFLCLCHQVVCCIGSQWMGEGVPMGRELNYECTGCSEIKQKIKWNLILYLFSHWGRTQWWQYPIRGGHLNWTRFPLMSLDSLGAAPYRPAFLCWSGDSSPEERTLRYLHHPREGEEKYSPWEDMELLRR